MALSKKVTLTAHEYSIKLSSDIKLYQNDAIHLIFEINEYGVTVNDSGLKTKTIMPVNPLYAFLIIECPNDNNSDKIESLSIVDNQVHFHIDARYTMNIGTGRMQVVLADKNCCQSTLPEFTYEVRENILGNGSLQIADVAISDIDGKALTVAKGEILTSGKTLLFNSGGRNMSVKFIKDLQQKGMLDGTEMVIIQDGEATKQTTTNSLYNYIINAFSDTIDAEIMSQIGVNADKLNDLATDLTDILVATEYLKRNYETKLEELEELKKKYQDLIDGLQGGRN